MQFIAFVILPFILGGLKAVKDVLKFRYDISIFPPFPTMGGWEIGLPDRIYNQWCWWSIFGTWEKKWIRKYWLLGFIPYAPFRDSWHTADFILWTLALANVVIAQFTAFAWWWIPVWIVCRWAGFTLFYEVLLIKKESE